MILLSLPSAVPKARLQLTLLAEEQTELVLPEMTYCDIFVFLQ